jgi:thiosulfate dehydrogenase [quinone] large subunit
MSETNTNSMQIPEPQLSKFLFADSRFAWFWLIVRLYVGWQWLSAGWEKLGNPVWTGNQAGVAIQGFLQAALLKATGTHPDVSNWYAALIQHIALPHVVVMSYIVTYSEIGIGIALILGLFTGIAAFMGSFWNMNYLFAGTVSINPLLFLLQLFLVLAWRSAGYYGLDRWLLPVLGTPWQVGKAFKK